LQNEKEQEKIRKIIFKSENREFGELFQQVDEKKEGFLGKKQVF